MTTARPTAASAAQLARPSSLYRTGLWSLGLRLARKLPRPVADLLCRVGASAYASCAARRRETVIQNLLPVCDGDRTLAVRVARAAFLEMAFKVADLWRVEGGVSLDTWTFYLDGWGTYAAARDRGHGVLMVTPHLGNWEMGGPLLARQGVKLVVVTQAEPGQGLTELRQSWRARWGIETMVIGQDEFAFIGIIRCLMDGKTVALLIDRPPAASAVTVELFGRPFMASVAAAELARASGCAVLGVFVVRQPGGYRAVVMPEFTYDRRALGDRAKRRELTQQILRAFEPVIRQHRDQWFHFVPIWAAR